MKRKNAILWILVGLGSLIAIFALVVLREAPTPDRTRTPPGRDFGNHLKPSNAESREALGRDANEKSSMSKEEGRAVTSGDIAMNPSGVKWEIGAVKTNKESLSAIDVQMERLLAAFYSYHKDLNSLPDGDAADIARALLGKNFAGREFLSWDKGRINLEGRLLDPWKMPLLIRIQGDNIEIRSAGSDKMYSTPDDVVVKQQF